MLECKLCGKPKEFEWAVFCCKCTSLRHTVLRNRELSQKILDNYEQKFKTEETERNGYED